MRRVVSVFLPNWAAERWWQLEAAQGVKPAAPRPPLVLARSQGGVRVIHAADQAALDLGLHPGMRVAQAQALQPGLRVEQAAPEEDAAALARLAGWCLRFTPLASACAPDGVWLDITGCAHLHGDEARLVEKLLARLAQAGISARAAIAPTPGAAHALARHGLDAICIVQEGALEAALAPLPVEALRLSAEQAAGLRGLGFETIGQLRAAARGPIARRFGARLLDLLDQAFGSRAEPIEPVLPADLCRVRQGFAEPIATADDLRRVTTLLAERLAEKLRARDEGASRLDLVFQRVDGTAALLRVGTSAPTRDGAHLSRLLCARLEEVDPGFGVESVMLAAPLTARLGARQSLSELVSPAQADLSALLDILLNRLGERRLFRAAPVESDVPERSLRLLGPGEAVEGDWPAHLPRPPRLVHPPRPVEAVALLPDQPPLRFVWRGVAHKVRCADGPERVFGEWWQDADEAQAVRDYFQVEDEAGQRFWLFRQGDGVDAGSGDLSWYLHGVFG